MKQVIDSLYYDARSKLNSMSKKDMRLSERIKYETALAQLDAMKRVLDKANYDIKYALAV